MLKRINLIPSPSSVIKNVLLKLSLTIHLNTHYVIYYWNLVDIYVVKVSNSNVKFDLEIYVQNEHHP